MVKPIFFERNPSSANRTINQTFESLKLVHHLYARYINDWSFFGSAYAGGREFVEQVLTQHPREEDDSFTQRVDEAINFNYSKSIVNLYTHFLTETAPSRDNTDFKKREDWVAFIKNADLYGTPFDTFLSSVSQLSAAFGTVGILVDKPGGVFNKDANLAPYCSTFTPPNILDWHFTRDPMRRSLVLDFIKLKESNTSVLVWTEKEWARYTLDEYANKIIEVSKGVNPLDEIPFVWVPNIKNIKHPYIGYSDLIDIARINASIIRNMSFSDEVLRYAAFPMLRMPKELDDQWGESSGDTSGEVIIGNRAVLDFDPEMGGDAKPDWLETAVTGPITAIHLNVNLKVEECYRTALLGGVFQNKDQAQTKSGVALRYEFLQLNSVLSKKSDNLIEAEKRMVHFFCKWQECEDLEEGYSIARVKSFAIDELVTELNYSFNAIDKVPSDTFKRCMYKHIVNTLLPSVPESKISAIEDEIDTCDLSVLVADEAVDSSINTDTDKTKAVTSEKLKAGKVTITEASKASKK